MVTRTERIHKRKRRWLKWIGIVLITLLVISAGTVYYMWDKINDTVTSIHNPLERDKDSEQQKNLQSLFKNTQSINILLLGVDERAGDRGRSDTMILLSLNPKTDSMIMMSIPRDTRVNIPGHGLDKVNHAYAYGDIPLAVETVEKAFNVPVDFYTKINMEGFKDGIDAIGGVTVYNEHAFTQDGINFNEGNIHLSGKEALAYIRMRKKDPRGDLGRNERQRDVIQAAVRETASLSGITKLGEILNIVGGNVKTNLHMDQLQKLFMKYRGTQNNIQSLQIKGNGQRIGGLWYYIVPDSEFDRISTKIRNHMEEGH